MTTKDHGIPTTPVTDESAWTGAEMSKNQVWLSHLKPDHLAEIDDAVQGLRMNGRTIQTLTKTDFPFPTFSGFLKNFMANDVIKRCFGLMRGLPRENYTDDELGMVYHGMGLHMGKVIPQNSEGHLIGHVRDVGDDYSQMNTRGYRTKAALGFHCDPCDVVGLLCLRTAKEGGISTLASGMTIFNTVLAEHPEYLSVLTRGFRYHRRGQNPPFLPPISGPIPVFSNTEGQISIRFVRSIINEARVKLNDPLTNEEEAALDFIAEVANRDGVALDMGFQEGDIQICNNHLVVHSRTTFVDHDEPERKRHLLRLWLKVPGIRKMSREFIEYHVESGWSRRDGILPPTAPPPKTPPELATA
jgi:hypothetical protein